MDKDARQRNRRRARAQFMKAKGANSAANGDETGDDEAIPIPKPPRPPNRRRKLREALFEEDIVDGFAIASFKTYQDLERAVHHAEKLGLRCLEPLSATPSASTLSRKRKRRPTNEESSGEAYFCDHSASDEDKVSDSGSGVFVASKKSNTDASRLSPPTNLTANGLASTTACPPLYSSHTPHSANQRLQAIVSTVAAASSPYTLSSMSSTMTSVTTIAATAASSVPLSLPAVATSVSGLPRVGMTVPAPALSLPRPILSSAPPTCSNNRPQLAQDSRGYLPHPGLIAHTPALPLAHCPPTDWSHHPDRVNTTSSSPTQPYLLHSASGAPHSSRAKFGILDLVSPTCGGSSSSRVPPLHLSTPSTAPATLSSSLASAYVPFSHQQQQRAPIVKSSSQQPPPLITSSSLPSPAASLVNGRSAVSTAGTSYHQSHRHYPNNHHHYPQQLQQVSGKMDSDTAEAGGRLTVAAGSSALTDGGHVMSRPVNLANQPAMSAPAPHRDLALKQQQQHQQQTVVSSHSQQQQQRHYLAQHSSGHHQYHPHQQQPQQLQSKAATLGRDTGAPPSGPINLQSGHHQSSLQSRHAAGMTPSSRLSLPSVLPDSTQAGIYHPHQPHPQPHPPPPAHHYQPQLHAHALQQQRMAAVSSSSPRGQFSIPGVINSSPRGQSSIPGVISSSPRGQSSIPGINSSSSSNAPPPRPIHNMMSGSPWMMDKVDRYNSHSSTGNRVLPSSSAMSPSAPPVQMPPAITTFSQPAHLPAAHSSAPPLPLPGVASGLPPTSTSTAPAQHFNNMLHCTGKSADALRRELDSRFLATLDRSGGGSTSVPGTPVSSTPTAAAAGSSSVLDLHQRSSVPPTNQLKCVKSVSSSYLNPRQQQHHHQSAVITGSAASTVLSPSAAPASLNFALPTVPLSLHHTKKTGRWNAMHVRIAWEIHRQQQQQNRQQRRSASRSSTPSISGGAKSRLAPVAPVKSPAAPAIRMPDPSSVGPASAPIGFPSASPVLSALSGSPANSAAAAAAASFAVQPHGGAAAAAAAGGFRFPGLTPGAAALPPSPLDAWNRFPHPVAGSIGVSVANPASAVSWPGAVDVNRRVSPLLSQQQKHSYPVQPSISANNNTGSIGAAASALKSGAAQASVLPSLTVGSVPRAPLTPYNGLLAATGGAAPPLDPFLAPLIYHRHHDPLAAALEHQRHLLSTAGIYGSAGKPLLYPPVAPLPAAHHPHPTQHAAMFGLALGGAVPPAAPSLASMAAHPLHVPRRADTHQPPQAPPR